MNREEIIMAGLIKTAIQSLGLFLPCTLIIMQGKKKHRIGLGITMVVISVLLACACKLFGFAIAWSGFAIMCCCDENKKTKN